MNRLTRLVLKRPVTTLLAVLALVVFGFSSLTTLRLELMPDMEMPMKIVYTVYPGADSESVDDLVTTPIEDKVGSLSGVKSITSSSMENVSMVLLQYDYDQNVNDAYLSSSTFMYCSCPPDTVTCATLLSASNSGTTS